MHSQTTKRRDFLRPRPRRYDGSGPERQRLVVERYTSPDPQRDPYLVALVIAIARRQRREASGAPPPATFTVHLFPTYGKRPMPLNLYVAHVKASFLDKLDFPSQESQPDSELDIYHWAYPSQAVSVPGTATHLGSHHRLLWEGA
ncbi:uncharacterized protein B0T15DRAFT_513955 [Chaetomium strumarium]|uniref:Uncharacterized protein n=1 Tax=Chaetomium strumarium TaxID=1170767 RepID=A0AAJ0GPM1_9PEZI|nr:hypothetical protein B0T15DRAFT_513955 [Chaetomium strumarium]